MKKMAHDSSSDDEDIGLPKLPQKLQIPKYHDEDIGLPKLPQKPQLPTYQPSFGLFAPPPQPPPKRDAPPPPPMNSFSRVPTSTVRKEFLSSPRRHVEKDDGESVSRAKYESLKEKLYEWHENALVSKEKFEDLQRMTDIQIKRLNSKIKSLQSDNEELENYSNELKKRCDELKQELRDERKRRG